MKFSLLIVFTLSTYITFSQTQDTSNEIDWMSWDEAIEARAKFMEENAELLKERKIAPKKIFIDAYTTWCGWCKKMDASTFKDPTVVKYMNERYYAVKLNAEMKDTIEYNGHKFFNPAPQGKKGTHTLASSLMDGKMSYPTYIIMDENVNRAAIFPGYKNVTDFFGIISFFGSNEYLRYKQYIEQTVKAQNNMGN